MRLGPYLLGPNDTPENGIYCGDARELAKAIPDGSIDAIFIDPPFFLPAQHYKTRKQWPRSIADLSVMESFLDAIFIECRRVLKDNGVFAVCCDGQSYPIMYVKLYPLFDRLVDLVWDKTQIGMGRGIRRQHELIILGLNSSDFPAWESSVISCTPVLSSDRIHPAEKPVELIKRIFTALVKRGSVVADFFCGSGTTLIAAHICGMKFIGFELDAKYVAAARERVRNTQPPLFVPESEQAELWPDS